MGRRPAWLVGRQSSGWWSWRWLRRSRRRGVAPVLAGRRWPVWRPWGGGLSVNDAACPLLGLSGRPGVRRPVPGRVADCPPAGGLACAVGALALDQLLRVARLRPMTSACGRVAARSDRLVGAGRRRLPSRSPDGSAAGDRRASLWVGQRSVWARALFLETSLLTLGNAVARWSGFPTPSWRLSCWR